MYLLSKKPRITQKVVKLISIVVLNFHCGPQFPLWSSISDKCDVLRITRKRNPVIFPYKLHKKELNVTNAAKYLGVRYFHCGPQFPTSVKY